MLKAWGGLLKESTPIEVQRYHERANNRIAAIIQKVERQALREGKLPTDPYHRPTITYRTRYAVNNLLWGPIFCRCIESNFTLRGIPRSRYRVTVVETGECHIVTQISFKSGDVVNIKWLIEKMEKSDLDNLS